MLGEKKKSQLPFFFFQWRKFVKRHDAVMNITPGNCTCIILVISFGEKCLLKSLHSCGSVVFFPSSRVIGEIGQKQHSCLLNKGRLWLLELVAGNAWSNIVREEQLCHFSRQWVHLGVLLPCFALSLIGMSSLSLQRSVMLSVGDLRAQRWTCLLDS